MEVYNVQSYKRVYYFLNDVEAIIIKIVSIVG